MNRGRAWLATAAIVVIAGAYAAPMFQKAFRLALTRAATVPVEAQAVQGDPAEPIAVEGSRPKQPPINLTVSGEIFGVVLGSVSDAVLVRVGNRSFAGQIQGGSYVATINSLDPAEMVSVEVTNGAVRRRSVVGSFRKLIQRSGGDRRVEAVELPSLRVSPWSSVLAFMVRTALGGRDAVSDAEFEQASRTLSGNDLINAYYLLANPLSIPYFLPSGYRDGQQLLENENVYRNWIAAQPTSLGRRTAVFAQNDYAALSSLSELPEQTLMLGPVPLQGFPVYSEAVQMLLRNADGSYKLYESEPVSAMPSYRASLDGSGDVVLQPLTPRVVEGYQGVLRMRMAQDRIVLRRLFDGERYDLWASRSEWTRTYPENPEEPPTAITTVNMWSVADLQAVARQGAWTSAPNRRVLPWPCRNPVQYPGSTKRFASCDFVQHRFDPGGGGSTEDHGLKVGANMQPQAAGSGIAFAWSTSGSQLRVQGPEATLRYWSIDGDDGVADTVVFLADGSAGEIAGHTMAGMSGSLATEDVPFSAAQALGTWTGATTLQVATAYPSTHYSMTIQRDPGGDGEQRDYEYAYGARNIMARWQVLSGRVFDTRSRAAFGSGATSYVRDCASAFAAGAVTCAPTNVRYFRPFKRVGDRWYGIEEVHSHTTLTPPGYTGTYDVTSVVRLSFYQCTAGACLAPTALSLPQSPAVLESRASTPIVSPVRLRSTNRNAHLRLPMQRLRAYVRPPAEAVRR